MRKSKPSEEIQSLLDMFVQDHEIFKGLPINLRRSRLNGADLQGAHLEKAVLAKAHLQGADLSGAHLQGADLSGAHLQGADLSGAHLQGADLSGAHLQGAVLYEANLQGSLLRGTYLEEANLGSARLQGSILPRAQFQGANLAGADLRGAGSQGNLSLTFSQRMRASADKESALAVATFAGGLSREDVEALVEDWPDEKATQAQERLVPHLDREAIREPLENSGAIIGAYTAEEAEQWIAEYEEVMSVFNEADDN